MTERRIGSSLRSTLLVLLVGSFLVTIFVISQEKEIFQLDRLSYQSYIRKKEECCKENDNHFQESIFPSPDLPKFGNATIGRTAATRPRKTTGVIIFTTMRAGSSFLGELFNQHGQVFYAFEPLHAFGFKVEQSVIRMKALAEVMNCDMANLAQLYKQARNKFPHVTDKSSRCSIDNFCFKHKSRFLSRDTNLCNDENETCRIPFDPEQLSKVCRRSLFPVAKIIAELTLENLQKVLDTEDHNIRVIHLVRDPRAVLTSRREVFTSDNTSYDVRKQSDYLCKHMEKNLRFADCFDDRDDDCPTASSVFHKTNYMRLRFEDVSLHPLEVAKRVYDFVDLNFDPAVEKWIRENTKKDTNHSGGLFSTKRDSIAAVGRWRSALTMEEVDSVQKRCAFVMNKLNYRTLADDAQLKDASLDLWW